MENQRKLLKMKNKINKFLFLAVLVVIVSQNINADNERILKEARSERDGMLKEAREIKNNLIEEAKEEAKIQANKLIEQAKTSIQSEKLAAISDLKNQVAELSINIAEKVVKDELSNKDKQLKLVEQMLKEAKLN